MNVGTKSGIETNLIKFDKTHHKANLKFPRIELANLLSNFHVPSKPNKRHKVWMKRQKNEESSVTASTDWLTQSFNAIGKRAEGEAITRPDIEDQVHVGGGNETKSMEY